MSFLSGFRGKWLGILSLVLAVLSSIGSTAFAQSLSGSIQGTVTDPSNAVVPGATVRIENPVSGYARQATTDADGLFQFGNIPFNPYHLTVAQQGFATTAQDVDVRSSVPVKLQIALALGTASTSVTVEATAEDMIETASSFHTDVDRGLFDTLPLESQSSSVSSLVTLASPGVVADSNGLFHGLGDHAENSFSVDGQPITDQQSKVFSNQIPVDSIQSMEVVSGAPPAEYGGKTSLVINVTTRSGLGSDPAHRQRDGFLRFLRKHQRRCGCRVRRQEMGRFHLREWPEYRPIPRPAGISSHACQGQPAKHFRPPGYSGQRRGHDSPERRLYALLVPDAELLRCPGDRAGSARTDQNVQHRAHLDPPVQFLYAFHLRRFRASGPLLLLSQRRPAPGSAADVQSAAKADQHRPALGRVLCQGGAQHQSGNHLPAHVPDRGFPVWSHGPDSQRRVPGSERRPSFRCDAHRSGRLRSAGRRLRRKS